MKYTCYDMNAYNLHIINTDKFKTITVGVAFRRKIIKDEITLRNLVRVMMGNATKNFPTERQLVKETEELYDLKFSTSGYRIGNYTVMSFKNRFLNEKYTEKGMNNESIKFLLDVIFNPKFDNTLNICKKKIEKGIMSLKDDKIRYSLFKLLETTNDKPYSYNTYGYLDDLEKINLEDVEKYYKSIIENDAIDVFVVGEVDENEIKNVFKEYFKATKFHKNVLDVIVPELDKKNKITKVVENDDVNQTQLAILCGINELTDWERKYVLPIYCEMLGGSSNSLLFDEVREKNSYAYYVNSLVKSYDNIMIIYSGIEKGNDKDVTKIIEKTLKSISKGKFENDKLENSKRTMISAIMASLDNPIGIINSYYAMLLVDSKDPLERIENIKKINRDDIITVSKKISAHTLFLLEATDEKNNN